MFLEHFLPFFSTFGSASDSVFTQDMKDIIAQPWLCSAVLAVISVCSDITALSELRAGNVDQTGCEQANNLARLI